MQAKVERLQIHPYRERRRSHTMLVQLRKRDIFSEELQDQPAHQLSWNLT